MSRERSITPFGRPGVRENVTENVIHRLTQVKPEEHEDGSQFSATDTSLLWLDFQDESWDMFVVPDMALPVSSCNGGLFSGPIWYACYAWDGAPILEGQRTLLGPRRPPIVMRHQGRFRMCTKIDAMVVSLQRHLFILENPYTAKPIRPWLWSRLLALPWFALQFSSTNWPLADLPSRIEGSRQIITALSAEAIYE